MVPWSKKHSKNKVIIGISGATAFLISAPKEYIEVEIWDYDIDNDLEKRLETDSNGEQYVRIKLNK